MQSESKFTSLLLLPEFSLIVKLKVLFPEKKRALPQVKGLGGDEYPGHEPFLLPSPQTAGGCLLGGKLLTARPALSSLTCPLRTAPVTCSPRWTPNLTELGRKRFLNQN